MPSLSPSSTFSSSSMAARPSGLTSRVALRLSSFEFIFMAFTWAHAPCTMLHSTRVKGPSAPAHKLAVSKALERELVVMKAKNIAWWRTEGTSKDVAG